MNQKTLISLFIGAVALAAIYLFAVPQYENQGGEVQRKLFEGVDGQRVKRLKFEQAAGTLEIEYKDGAWRVPSRGNYPADGTKISALLLKLFDLDVSQKVPADASTLSTLGVTDDAIARGMTKVSFLDGDGKVVSAAYLGESRRSSKEKGPGGPLSGQFVRRVDQQEVFLIATPVPITMGAAAWLEANLMNVLQSAIYSVAQVKLSEAGEEQLFELVRSGEEDAQMKAPQLTLLGGIPQGKALQQTVATQVRAGLENLRISDAFPAGADEVKDLKFDFLSVYRTGNGLIYKVQTAPKGDKFYAKIQVTFDSDLAAKLQAEDAAKRAAAKAAATPEPAPSSGDKPQPAPSKAPEPEPLKVSNNDEAKTLNEKFAPWIYEVPGYQARKLRNTKTDLIEPPAPPPPPPPGAPIPPEE